ncbi:hypothetical protein MTR_7g022420 [Medicago truncatula]|uniref:Transmembrane protein n=1 Tax=Medicago truncatula TaxID=3880 RepID=G7KUS3_MEDTR|nr:hypothetical protein MTR_7g022420 [Medicago truncatula]
MAAVCLILNPVHDFLCGIWNLIEAQRSKGKEGYLSTSKGIMGGVSNFSKVQGDPSFQHRK